MEPIEKIQKVLNTIARLVPEDRTPWVVGGSAGLLLRGLRLDLPPRDLDLYADEQHAAAVHALLAPYAADEPVLSRTGRYRSILSHYQIEGIAVELVGGFEVAARDGLYRAEVQQVLRPYGHCSKLQETSFTIAPLAHEWLFNVLRERQDRVALIEQAVAQAPDLHEMAFGVLASRNAFSAVMKQRLLAFTTVPRAGYSYEA